MTATTTDGFKAGTCEDYGANAIVSVYTGTGVGALTDAALPAQHHRRLRTLTAAVVVPTVVGRTYFVSVRGTGDTADTFMMDLTSLALTEARSSRRCHYPTRTARSSSPLRAP